MPKENTGNGILLGTIIGSTVGAVAALLLAPKSGVKLREDISSKFQALCQKTQDVASTVGRTTKEIVANVKEEASELGEHAKESGQHIMESMSTTKDDIKDRLTTTTK